MPEECDNLEMSGRIYKLEASDHISTTVSYSYMFWLGSSRKDSACELLDQCWEGALENCARNGYITMISKWNSVWLPQV